MSRTFVVTDVICQPYEHLGYWWIDVGYQEGTRDLATSIRFHSEAGAKDAMPILVGKEFLHESQFFR